MTSDSGERFNAAFVGVSLPGSEPSLLDDSDRTVNRAELARMHLSQTGAEAGSAGGVSDRTTSHASFPPPSGFTEWPGRVPSTVQQPQSWGGDRAAVPPVPSSPVYVGLGTADVAARHAEIRPPAGNSSEPLAQAHRIDRPPLLTPRDAGPRSRPLPASLGARVASTLIDAGVIMGVVIAVGLVSTLALAATPYGPGYSMVASLVSLGQLLLFPATIAYLIHGWGSEGTVGMRAMRIVIVDQDTLRTIGFGRSALRYLMMFAMGLPCYLGYLTILEQGSGYNRGWHDQAARSIVIQN